MKMKVNKIRVFFSLLFFLIIFIPLISDVINQLNTPEPYNFHNEFKEYSIDQINEFNFYVTTGYDSREDVLLQKVQKEELFRALQSGLAINNKARYNSTDHYVLEITFNDNKSYTVDFLLQNDDAILVSFMNRSYNSSMILDWFSDYFY
ncbi:MAG: hypothetical protein PQJ44_01810 [Sphaerochaetaceae bacterium]|nr:hypothetical protein [Sphaerochaetaceae bacterium]